MSGNNKNMGQSRNIVFLVGMPRSGTKLLRDLLNRHSAIAIFPNESHFIPALYQQGSKYGDLLDPAAFAALHADLADTTFFTRLAGRGIQIDPDDWYRRLRGGEVRDALAALFECYAAMASSRIVGDKTPEYLTQVPLLTELFPGAKFVHIVRDPRDYVISMRKAWGKSLLRAAYRWKAWIRKFGVDVRALSVDYVEVRYEDLLSAPRPTLQKICDFLGVEFEAAMLTLDKPSENLGDAQGAVTIVADNFGKWKQKLSATEIRQIEMIAGGLMAQLGYTVEHHAGDEDVHPLMLQLCRLIDGVNLFRFGLQEGGLRGGIAEIRRAGGA
jgi:hypothetical protein